MSCCVKAAARMNGLKGYVGAPRSSLIDLPLAGTECPVPLEGTPDFIAGYPHQESVLQLLAERWNVPTDMLLLTAGADEAIDRACRAFVDPGARVVTTTPTFEMIAHFAALAGGVVDTVPWLTGSLPVDALIRKAHGAALLVIVTPNNPTGTAATREEIRHIASALPSTLILVDAAYGEFVDDDYALGNIAGSNILHLRTLSKAWGAPGLRIGYSVAHPFVIDRMRAAGGPYTIAHPSLVFAEDWLCDHADDARVYCDRIREERTLLREVLISLGVDVEPSQANFVLARTPRAKWLVDSLASLGISTRHFPHVENAVRITCPGDGVQFERLCLALRASLAPEAIIFDLDGVLADVSTSYRQAIIQTVASYSVPVTAEDIQNAKARGNANNDWVLSLRLIQGRSVYAEFEDVKERFEAYYQGTEHTPGLHTTEKLLGDAAFLNRLKKHVRLGMVTGRPRRDAERFLNLHGLRDCFESLVCMEDAELKPDPAPVRLCLEQLGVQAAWMIGDTPDDAVAARGAGVIPVGVLPPGDAPEILRQGLETVGVARILDDVNQLEGLLP